MGKNKKKEKKTNTDMEGEEEETTEAKETTGNQGAPDSSSSQSKRRHQTHDTPATQGDHQAVWGEVFGNSKTDKSQNRKSQVPAKNRIKPSDSLYSSVLQCSATGGEKAEEEAIPQTKTQLITKFTVPHNPQRSQNQSNHKRQEEIDEETEEKSQRNNASKTGITHLLPTMGFEVGKGEHVQHEYRVAENNASGGQNVQTNEERTIAQSPDLAEAENLARKQNTSTTKKKDILQRILDREETEEDIRQAETSQLMRYEQQREIEKEKEEILRRQAHKHTTSTEKDESSTESSADEENNSHRYENKGSKNESTSQKNRSKNKAANSKHGRANSTLLDNQQKTPPGHKNDKPNISNRSAAAHSQVDHEMGEISQLETVLRRSGDLISQDDQVFPLLPNWVEDSVSYNLYKKEHDKNNKETDNFMGQILTQQQNLHGTKKKTPKEVENFDQSMRSEVGSPKGEKTKAEGNNQRVQKQRQASLKPYDAIVEEIRNLRPATPGTLITEENSEENGMVVYTNSPVFQSQAPGKERQDLNSKLDETLALPLSKLTNIEDLGIDDSVIKTKGTVKFVLLTKPIDGAAQDQRWGIPKTQLFHDFMNHVECEIIRGNILGGETLAWSNQWGQVGLLGITYKNEQLAEGLRFALSEIDYEENKFTTIPQDCFKQGDQVTVLLKDMYRNFDLTMLAPALFHRNKKLQGSLQLLRAKLFTSKDSTKAGVNKAGWRLAIFEGSYDFMESIRSFTQDHNFVLGSGHVQIRGGQRKSKPRTTTGPPSGYKLQTNTYASAAATPKTRIHSTPKPQGTQQRITIPNTKPQGYVTYAQKQKQFEEERERRRQQAKNSQPK
jgi:hypothetical protein